MKRDIQLSIPNLSTDIVENLRECIETGWVSTGGRFIGEFEKKLADYVAAETAVSVQSGTAGLHLALRELGVGHGDEVIVPTLTFIAAVNPVAYLGAVPVFMDCDDSLCMDVDKLAQFLEKECEKDSEGQLINRTTKAKVKVVVAVHIFGNTCNMERIMELAERYGLKVLEDATEALGTCFTEGRYQRKFAGTVGDIGVYSFNANKIITTGGGGMIVAKDKKTLEHIRYLSITAKNDSLFFVHDEIGYNYRMLNTQAALGVSQIDHLEEFIGIKIRNYNIYKEQISHVPGISLLPFRKDIRANYWFYSLLIDHKKYGIGRDELMQRLIAEGVQCRPVWKLCHTQKPYTDSLAYQIERAGFYEKHILNVPCSTNLSEEDIQYVCNIIER
jgi:aminotransferase in exopolysaccharide biosynthesis